jgi:Phage integrase, N-terminal SAM-like domain
MQLQGTHAVSGHVFRVERKRGPQWYVKYRVGDRQSQKRLGAAWLELGQAPPGYYTRRRPGGIGRHPHGRSARRGPPSTESSVTVEQAAEEWLRHCEWERGAKASTLSEYGSVVRAHILPRFGDQSIESVTARQIEAWAAELLASGRSRRTVNKVLTMLHGIFERARRVWDLPANPVADVTRGRDHDSGGRITRGDDHRPSDQNDADAEEPVGRFLDGSRVPHPRHACGDHKHCANARRTAARDDQNPFAFTAAKTTSAIVQRTMACSRLFRKSRKPSQSNTVFECMPRQRRSG